MESLVNTQGVEMWRFAADLYPICRSITGDGVRETLRRVAKRVPLTVHEVPTGTPVLDWTVPQEWNIDAAYVVEPDGQDGALPAYGGTPVEPCWFE